MPAAASVLIIISAKDMASAVIKQLGADMKQGFDKSLKGLEKYQEGLKDIGKTASSMGKKMSIGVTAPLALFAGVAVNSAVKAQRLTQTLDGLAGGADKAASFITAIKTASMGTIPQVQALEIANKALSFEVVSTEQGMASLVETAIVLGKAQGLDAATAVSDLTTAMARQSPMILDNLGITLKMSEASAIAAEHYREFGFETGNLTKAQEFQIAAMVKGQEAAAKMGGMQEDMATQTERVKAQMADMATTIGGSLIPVMQTGVGIVSSLVEKFSSLDSRTQGVVIAIAAMAAGIGPALSAFGSVTTAVATFTAAITAAGGGVTGLKAVLTGTNASFLAVGAAVVAVTAVIATYNAQNEKVAEAAAGAVDAAAAWSDRADEMIAGGSELSGVLGTLSAEQNEATKIFKDAGPVVRAAGEIFGISGKMASVYAETQGEVSAIVIKNTSSHKDYVAAIIAYNAQVTSSAAKVKILSEAQFNMATIMQKGASEASLLADSLMQQQIAMSDTESIARERLDISERQAESDANATASAMDLMLATEDLTTADTANIETRMDALNTSRDAVAQGAAEVEATKASREALAAHTEKVNAVTDMQTASSQRQAEALNASRQAAIGAAEAQVALAGSLKDATDAQIASTLIEQLDPDALGAVAYAEGVQQIQLAFGLADEKSIAMASGVTELAAAINEGVIPYENYDEALTAVIADAADGQTNTAALLDEFARAPGLIGPSAEKLESLNKKLAINSEESITAAEGVEEFGAGAARMTSDVDMLTGSVTRLNTELQKVGSATLPSIPTGDVPRFQFGGVVPGPIGGPPRLVMAEPGETFTPPSQRNVNNNFGNNSQTVTINDSGALGFFEEQQRQDRLSKLSANL